MCRRLLGISAFVCFANLSVAGSPQPSPTEQFHYETFGFAPGRSCETAWIDSSFCESTHPKNWTEEEFREMSSLLEPIFQGSLPNFLARVESNGYKTFFRYANAFQKNPDGKTYSHMKYVGMWVWPLDLSINIGDGILDADSSSFQNLLGFDMRKTAVLHEIVHAFDNGLSYSEEFLNLVGWIPEGRGHILRGVDPMEFVAVVERMKYLSSHRQFEELVSLNRTFGMKYGFPSAYAMTIPQECFADIAAHIFYDPNVRDYMKPEWIEWFHKNVLR